MKNFIFIGGSYGIGLSSINQIMSKKDQSDIKIHVYSRSSDHLNSLEDN